MLRLATRAATIAMACFAACFATGCGSGEDLPLAAARPEQYRTYLEENTGLLVAALESMLAEIEHGEVSRAGSRYARARVRYSQIEPAAEMFGRLDSRIDSLEGDVPSSEFGGFHRIEKALWAEETTKGMTVVARRLLADAKELERKFETSNLGAEQLAGGASRILAEISASKLAGDEEPYSLTTLVDVSANVEAVEAAFEALRPVLADQHDLAAEIQAQLTKTYAALSEYGTPAHDPEQPRDRSPGALFVIYSELSPAEIDKLRRQVDALAAPFDELGEQIEGS